MGFDQRIRVAPYTAKGDPFAGEQPRLWSEKAFIVDFATHFDLMPDGKRFVATLLPSGVESERRTHVTFLLNFGDELRRRVPEGK